VSEQEKDVRRPAPAPKTPPKVDPAADDNQRDTLDWMRFGLIAIAILYALILLLLNNERIKIDFLFFSANARLWILLLLTFALGGIAGVAGARLYARRNRGD
jgi:uncharacterized integral membrane protein